MLKRKKLPFDRITQITWVILFLLFTPLVSVEQTWLKTGGPIGGLGYNIKVHPTNSNIMFVNDAFAGVYKSMDGGQTWQVANTGITTRTGPSNDAIPVFTLEIDQMNPNIIWAGTKGVRGIFKSTDGGQIFTQKDNGIVENNGLTIRNFKIDHQNSDTVYATGDLSVGVMGTEFEKLKGLMYKTVDGGENWVKIWEDSSLARWLCINHDDEDTMLMTTGIFDREALNDVGLGIMRSDNGGNDWYQSNSGISGSLFVGGMDDHPDSANVTMIATGNYVENSPVLAIFGGIFKTGDAGVTWNMVLPPQAPASPGSSENVFTAVEYAPSDPSIVYAANAMAFYKSTDAGVNWTRYVGPLGAPYGPPGIRAGVPIEITVDEADPNIILVANYGGGVFKSVDGAQSWSILGSGMTGASLHDVAVSPQNDMFVIVNGRSGPFKSADGGITWQGIYYPDVIGVAEWYSVAIDPTNASTLFIGDEHTGSIFKSTDAGSSWVKVFTHPEADPSDVNKRHGAKELVIAASNSQVMYAGFVAAGFFYDVNETSVISSYGVYRSSDGGNSWVEKNLGIDWTNQNITAIAVHPMDENIVYIGIRGDGIFKSLDGGDNWIGITANLPEGYIYSIGVSSIDPNIIYAGTRSNGIWQSLNGGGSWISSLTGTYVSGNFPQKIISSIVVSPVDHNIIYAADFGSGVYYTDNGGGNWTQINNGLSTRAVSGLAISSDGAVVYAASYGEGLFRLGTPTGTIDHQNTGDGWILSIDPNPLTSTATVNVLMLPNQDAIMEIIDVNGKLRLKESIASHYSKVTSYVVNLDELKSGLYFIRFQITGHPAKSARIVVQ